MADKLSKLAKGFTKAISARGKKPSGYTATAEVTRVDDKTAWVILPGSEIETPVSMAVSAKKGDTVTIRIENHRAVLTGNTTAPPTDDSRVDSLETAISSGVLNGEPGMDAVNILKVVNEYCLADDWQLEEGETFEDIQHEGSDWSEEFPDYTEDDIYVWARSVTYFISGDIEYGQPYFYYTAAYVTKVETQFCLANNRVIPEGQTFNDIQYTEWSTEIVELVTGKYYWRRTATYFSDGSVVYSDPEFDPSLQVMYETEAAINAAVSAAESAQEAAETAEGEASDAQTAAEQAKDDAVNVVNNQKKHFWYDSSTGAHVSQAENSIDTGAAVNATASALTFTKDGYILGSLSRNALNFYDGDGAAASDANLLASYSKNGTTFYTNKHRSTSLTNSAVTFWDPTDTTNDGTVNQRKMAIFAKSSAQFYSDGNIMANWASNALNFYDGSAAAASANNLLASYTRSGVVLYGKYGNNAANTRLASFTPSGVTFWDPSDGNTAQAIFGSSGISFNTSVPFTIGNSSSYVKWVKKNNVWTIDIATDHLSIGGVDAATIDDVEDVPALSQITQVAKSATWATVQGWVGLTNYTWSGITSFSGNVGDTVLIAISVTDRDGQTGYMRCVVKGYSGTTITTDNIDFMFGPTGQQGDTGTTFTPSVDASGNISWSNDGGKTNPTTRNIKGPEGDEGTTFTPSVDANGNISWTNNGGKTNPTTRNIMGPEGPSSTYMDFYGSSYASANQGLFIHSDAKGTLPSSGTGVQITSSAIKFRNAGRSNTEFTNLTGTIGRGEEEATFYVGSGSIIDLDSFVWANRPSELLMHGSYYGFKMSRFGTPTNGFTGNYAGGAKIQSRFSDSSGYGDAYVMLVSGGGTEDIPDAAILIKSEFDYGGDSFSSSIALGQGAIALTGKIKFPQSVVASYSNDNQTVYGTSSSNDSYKSITVNCSRTGYTPIAILNWNLINASSSGANASHIVVYGTILSGNTATVKVRNLGSGDAKIKVTVTCLYSADVSSA